MTYGGAGTKRKRKVGVTKVIYTFWENAAAPPPGSINYLQGCMNTWEEWMPDGWEVPRAAASGSAAARVAQLASRGARSRGLRGSQQVERGRRAGVGARRARAVNVRGAPIRDYLKSSMSSPQTRSEHRPRALNRSRRNISI